MVTVEVTVTSLVPENVSFHVCVWVASKLAVLFSVKLLVDCDRLFAACDTDDDRDESTVPDGLVGLCRVLVWVIVRYVAVVVEVTVKLRLSSMVPVSHDLVKLFVWDSVIVSVSEREPKDFVASLDKEGDVESV